MNSRAPVLCLVGLAVACDQFPDEPPLSSVGAEVEGGVADAADAGVGGAAGASPGDAGGVGGIGVEAGPEGAAAQSGSSGQAGSAGADAGADLVVSVSASADDGNEDDGFDGTSGTIWFGNGNSVKDSYTALRFQNVEVPPGAQVTEAILEAKASDTAWVPMGLELAAQATDSCGAYSNGQRPSKRALTSERATHESNVEWKAGQWYPLADLAASIAEVVTRSGWKSGNALCIIGHGTGESFGRKFANSFDGSPQESVRLRIHYTLP